MAVLEPSRLNVRVQEICSQLKELALQQGPGTKLPTTRQLCQLFNTNPTTLNDALKQLEAQDVISRRQGSGIFVSSRLYRKCITILFCARLCIADATSPFWGMLWSLFASEMEKRNATDEYYCSFHLVLDLPGGEETLPPGKLGLPESFINEVLNQQVHGVLAVGIEKGVYEWLTQHQIPSVTFAGLGTGKIRMDSMGGTSMGARRLIEQGCQRPEMWLPYWPKWDDEVYTCWHEILVQAHCRNATDAIQIADPIFVQPYNSINDYQQQGYRLALKVFGGPQEDWPDGIFINNDLMTAGILCALEELGIQVGKDVHIVSNANAGSPILPDIRTREITLLEIDPGEIVQSMFTQLDLLIHNTKSSLDDENVFIAFKPRYVTRHH